MVPSLQFLLALSFLGLPEPVNQSPVDLLKLVAFLHICSIFTVVPSQLKSVSLVSLALFSLLCHNKNWWLKGSVFCYCIDKMFHVLNIIFPTFMQRLPLFLNTLRLEMFPQSVICIFDNFWSHFRDLEANWCCFCAFSYSWLLLTWYQAHRRSCDH